MAEHIAAEVDPVRFGVKGMYVFGSTKNATAGPGSDIDLIVHVDANEQTRQQLEVWLEGWSLCLSEINYLRTGYRTEGLLDVKIVTDADFTNHSSFATKIGAITDPARALPLRRSGWVGQPRGRAAGGRRGLPASAAIRRPARWAHVARAGSRADDLGRRSSCRLTRRARVPTRVLALVRVAADAVEPGAADGCGMPRETGDWRQAPRRQFANTLAGAGPQRG